MAETLRDQIAELLWQSGELYRQKAESYADDILSIIRDCETAASLSPKLKKLRAERDRMREALEPFAKAGEAATKYKAGRTDDDGICALLINGKYDLTYGDLRRAYRAARQALGGEDGD